MMFDEILDLFYKPTKRIWLGCIASIIAVTMLAFTTVDANAQSAKFEFGVLGDTDYSLITEQELPKMIAEMNKENLSFVVHVGDFEADPRPYNRRPTKISMPCVAENFKRVKAVFQTSNHPFVLSPGDNDWTDCSKLKAKTVNPLDALAMIRTMFYPKGKSLGQNPMAVVSQSSDAGFSKFVENQTWTKGGVIFATVHMVGSNNNMGKKPQPCTEFTERTAANAAWISKAFGKARAEESRW